MSKPHDQDPGTYRVPGQGNELGALPRGGRIAGALARVAGLLNNLGDKADDAGVAPRGWGYMGPDTSRAVPEPRKESDIIGVASRVDPSGWAHDTGSGRLPKLTPEILDAGDKAVAAGEDPTAAIEAAAGGTAEHDNV